MTELLGRIVGNTIVLDAPPPPDLPEGQEARIRVEALPSPPKQPRKAGILKGKIIMVDDFNDTPPGFEEYMQ